MAKTKKYRIAMIIAFVLWFVISVVFAGTPSRLNIVFLPGLFIVDAMVTYDSAGTLPIIYMFGSVLNLVIYLAIAKGISKLVTKK